VHIECPDCVIVVRGNEYDDWPHRCFDGREHFESVHAWHLHVKEHDIRSVCTNGDEGVGTIARLRDNGHLALGLQQRPQSRSHQRLVVHDCHA
jgi:hypothetical protein